LPDVKLDPQRATSPDIESGIRSLHQGQYLEAKTRLQIGIDDVVVRLAGANNLDDYDKVKPATDKILKTYVAQGGLSDKDKAAVVKAVNEYLGGKVIAGIRNAQNEVQLDRAKKVAVSYVTDPGPNNMRRKDRLIFLIDRMSMAGVDQKIIDDVKRDALRFARNRQF